jgi:hypothetical protein
VTGTDVPFSGSGYLFEINDGNLSGRQKDNNGVLYVVVNSFNNGALTIIDDHVLMGVDNF